MAGSSARSSRRAPDGCAAPGAPPGEVPGAAPGPPLRKARDRGRGRLLAALGLLLLVFGLYLLLGRYPKPGLSDPRSFYEDEVARRILLSVRLPRALGAALLGAVLAASGAAFQAVFGNPLVEPGFLGVSQGAAFGAALALVLGAGSPLLVSASAFSFALLALWLSMRLARRFSLGGQVLRLVLAGIAISALFAAGLAFVKYAADPLSQLPDITFWTMGGLSAMGWSRLLPAALPALLSLLLLLLLRWRINLLSLDDEVAAGLGLRPALERGLVIVAATAGVAAVTAVSGIVSWVGLLVPHVARLGAGEDARDAVPASLLLGASFVLICDGAARSLLPGELPLGIATALVGSLGFSLLLAGGAARGPGAR